MDRKQFLTSCAGGLCACAAALCMPEAAAAEPKPDDWRLPFVKQRYAKLLEILSQKMDGGEMSAALQELGGYCASQHDEATGKFRGKPEEYGKFLTQHGNAVTYDEHRNAYTQAYDPGPACFCPLADARGKTPGSMCDCSVGWAKHNWGIVLGREPKVTLLESFLRGGKLCKFEITPA